MTTAIMAAMPEEISALLPHVVGARVRAWGRREYVCGELFGREVVLVQSRLGKVAAAATAMHLVGAMGARRVLFTGVAGGVAPGVRIGDVVVARELYQHDLDASPIFPALEIPLLGVAAIGAAEGMSSRLLTAAEGYLREEFAGDVALGVREAFAIGTPRAVRGDIASGDQFFSSRGQLEALRVRVPTAAAVEMEGAAVAQVCHEHDVPFAVVRTISDTADEHAAADFPRFLREVAGHYALGIIRRFLAGEDGGEAG